MTETRKQIIELIEPYMNKELSEGCLMYHQFLGKEKSEIIQIRNSKYGLTGYSYDGKRMLDLDLTGDFYTKKILGHYDITAVLKYIESVHYHCSFRNSGEHLEIVLNFETYTDEYFIPNKPLHLCTEQEEKDLLKLLKELGQKLVNK